MNNKFRAFLVNALLLIASLLFAALFLEITSRIVSPISPKAQFQNAEGREITTGTQNLHRMRPGRYRQISNEFDIEVTVNSSGFRGAEPTGAPEVVFLGDSFTFGHGLRDNETFAAIYCAQRGLACANLGRSGTGTMMQANILRHYLKSENWTPRRVLLFVMAMTGSLSEGNDLNDNLLYERDRERQQGVSQKGTKSLASPTASFPNTRKILTYLLEIRKPVLSYSNLARVLYFHFGPYFRAVFAPGAQTAKLEEALALTRKSLAVLGEMAHEKGFTLEVYLLHPMQDIMRRSASKTFEQIDRILPEGVAMVATYQLFQEQPLDAYYAYDGHFNSTGAQIVADLLLKSDGK